MKKNVMIELEAEEKDILASALQIIDKIAQNMNDADSYEEVDVAYCSIDENHNFGNCIDEIHDATRVICDYLSHQSW